jgi:hypothetical protein
MYGVDKHCRAKLIHQTQEIKLQGPTKKAQGKGQLISIKMVIARKSRHMEV